MRGVRLHSSGQTLRSLNYYRTIQVGYRKKGARGKVTSSGLFGRGEKLRQGVSLNDGFVENVYQRGGDWESGRRG